MLVDRKPAPVLAKAVRNDDLDLPLPDGMTPDSPEESSTLARFVWSAEEDAQITELVATHGTKSWSVIARGLPTRTGKQCRERWHNHLDPNINKSEWTLEEDTALLAAHKTIGNKWADIAKALPGRTDNQVKNRWNSALRRELRKLNRLANKQKGAVKEAMEAATAAAIAVSSEEKKATPTTSGGDAPTAGVSLEPVGAVLRELTAGGGASNPAVDGADKAAGKAGASKPCKKKASLQMTATALQAATAAQETLLDDKIKLPFGVTAEDQANARVLLEHVNELNAAWAAAEAEAGGDASKVEELRAAKLRAHVDWLQEFNTSLVTKSLLRRFEPKAPEEEEAPAGRGKRKRTSKGAEDAGAPAAKAKRRRGKKGGAAAAAASEEEEEEEEEVPGAAPVRLSVGDVMQMAAQNGRAEWPLMTLPLATPHPNSTLASPLAIYETDFSTSGCFAAPHHFLSPRSVEQLRGECLSAGPYGPMGGPGSAGPAHSATSCTSATSSTGTGSHHGSVSEGRAGAGAGGFSALDGLSAVGSAALSARSAAEVAADVYQALGGLATLAASAPPKLAPEGEAGGRPTLEGADPAALEPSYLGAGVSERRKPVGMMDLCLPMTSASSGPAGPASALSLGPLSAMQGGFSEPLPSAGPISARTVELSALLSPALGELGVGSWPGFESANNTPRALCA